MPAFVLCMDGAASIMSTGDEMDVTKSMVLMPMDHGWHRKYDSPGGHDMAWATINDTG